MAEEADQGVSGKGSKDLLISSLEGGVHSSSNALYFQSLASNCIVYLTSYCRISFTALLIDTRKLALLLGLTEWFEIVEIHRMFALVGDEGGIVV